jgi:hypothetical protein
MNNQIPIPNLNILCPAEDTNIEALRDIYLAAGLSFDNALRSALADYECFCTAAIAYAA